MDIHRFLLNPFGGWRLAIWLKKPCFRHLLMQIDLSMESALASVPAKAAMIHVDSA